MIKVDNIKRTLIGNEFFTFDYTKQPIKESEVNRWREEGYYHKSFTGALYSSKNPMPEWTIDISNAIGLKNCGQTFYKMDTLDIMPPHYDHFETYEGVQGCNNWHGIVHLRNVSDGTADIQEISIETLKREY